MNPAVFSEGLRVAVQLMASESLRSGNRTINNQELWLCICGLENVLNQLTIPNQRAAVGAEVAAIDATLSAYNVSVSIVQQALCREVNARYEQALTGVSVAVPFSEEVSKQFIRAQSLAASVGATEVNCLHILAAALEYPGQSIGAILQQSGSDVFECSQHLKGVLSKAIAGSVSGSDDVSGWVEAGIIKASNSETNLWQAESGYRFRVVLVGLPEQGKEIDFDARSVFVTAESNEIVHPFGVVPLVVNNLERFSVTPAQRAWSEGLAKARPLRYGIFFAIPASFQKLTLWSHGRPELPLKEIRNLETVIPQACDLSQARLVSVKGRHFEQSGAHEFGPPFPYAVRPHHSAYRGTPADDDPVIIW
ncbi:MAG: hypothetical protein AB7L09_13015 [Nitrospira sp.]